MKKATTWQEFCFSAPDDDCDGLPPIYTLKEVLAFQHQMQRAMWEDTHGARARVYKEERMELDNA